MPGAFIRRSRHGTVFHFRRRVPRQLQAMLGRTHINASMGTIDRREALVRARRLAVDTDRVFAELHRMANPKRPSSSPVITVGLVYKFGQVHIRTEPHDSEADREKAHELARELASRVGPNQAQPAPAIDPVTQPGKSLGDAVDEFLAGIAKPKTFRTYRTALKRKAIPYFGADTPVSTIDQTWFARYVREIFADPKGAHNTKQGYINAFTSMFSMLRAMDPHGTAALTTKRLIPPNPTPDDEQRDAFSFDDLRVLLANACRFKRTEPHKYWVTVASTFMGGRIEELAQAELAADLRQEPQSGRWFLDVNERVDRDGVKRKSRKKDASRRSLPIHSALQKRGLVQ